MLAQKDILKACDFDMYIYIYSCLLYIFLLLCYMHATNSLVHADVMSFRRPEMVVRHSEM